MRANETVSIDRTRRSRYGDENPTHRAAEYAAIAARAAFALVCDTAGERGKPYTTLAVATVIRAKSNACRTGKS